METALRGRAGGQAADDRPRHGAQTHIRRPTASRGGRRRDRRTAVVIIVDTALRAREQQGTPIRVGMIGAGFMGQGLTNQIENSVPGMRMAAIYNRTMERALEVYRYAGRHDVTTADTQQALDDQIRRGMPVVAEDPFTICRSPEIDVLVDVTGSVE